MPIPTIAVKESLDDLKGIGPSTGISGFKLVYVIGKGLYQWQTGDQSSNVPSGNDGDAWVAPAEDTSGASGAWQLDDSGILDPEHATDSGTDAFVSATNTTVPGDGVRITRDFQTKNSTTTPTLDGKTITDRDGNALWAGAINGVHELQYASGTDTYLLLQPADVLSVRGGSSDPSLAFDTWRTPNADRPTLVTVRFNVETDGTSDGNMIAEVDEDGGTASDYQPVQALISADANAGTRTAGGGSFIVPAGGSYQIRNVVDPNNNNIQGDHREFTL